MKDTLHIVTCPHCNRQCESNGLPEDTCFWCHKPLRKERNLMPQALIPTEEYGKTREKNPNLPPEHVLPPVGPEPVKTYSREEQLAIAREAKIRGCKVVGPERGIPLKRIAMWLARFVRYGDIPRDGTIPGGRKVDKEGHARLYKSVKTQDGDTEDVKTFAEVKLSDLNSLTPEEVKQVAAYLLGWKQCTQALMQNGRG